MRSLRFGSDVGVAVDRGELEAIVSARMGRSYRLSPLPIRCTYPVYRGDADGALPVFVKIGRQDVWDVSLRVSRLLADEGLAMRMLTDDCVSCRGWAVFIMEWTDSVSVFPEDMNDRQIDSFVAGVQRLAQVLRRAGDIGCGSDGWDSPERLHAVVADYARRHPFCSRACSNLLSVPAAERSYGALPTTVIHGDFHAGNFAFLGDDFSCIFDFDRVREGLPCCDVVTALVERFSSLSMSAVRRRRLKDRTRRILKRLPWPTEALRIAVNVLRLEFAARRILKHPDGMWVGLDIERRDRRIREIFDCFEYLPAEGRSFH